MQLNYIMKKLIMIMMAAVLCASASAFSAREHATVATIAEKYLTPKARRAIAEITSGERIVALASHPDKFRDVYLYNGNRISHAVPYDADFVPSTDIKTSALGAINMAMRALEKGNYRNCPADSALIYLAWIVHFAGDMHCPSHLSFAEGSTPVKVKDFAWGKTKCRFHLAWDKEFTWFAYFGGPTDLAHLADIASPAMRKQYQKGQITDWAAENAKVCVPFIFDAVPDENGLAVVNNAYVQQHAAYAKNQVMKAGYRLAELLNRVFK